MTDKKIIDVTKCIHFNKSDISNGCTCYWDGECNHFCYFKQLKRKEQECTKMKQALDEIEDYCKECNLKADFTACEILDIIDKIKK